MKIISLFWHSVDSNSIYSEKFCSSNPTVSLFKEQIKFIVDNYTPISIFDFVKIRDDKNLIGYYKKPPILLGFDDGFKNVINYALPVLTEFNIPTTFFVIGEILKNPDFVPWYVEVEYLLRGTKKKMIVYEQKKIDLMLKQSRVLLRHLFSHSFKVCRSEEKRQELLNNLANLLAVERPKALDLHEDLLFVSKEDLINLSHTSLLTVASHAMTHRNLSSLTRKEQIYELEQSHLLLSRYCPSYYPTISYPDGSFNTDTISIATEIYKSAFAVLLGSSYRNLFAYPRLCIENNTIQELAYATSYKRVHYLLPLKKFLHRIGKRRI
jgi:peptidoglycan/xylan/chitin deacetylase (PgdA/CDA1 family)